MDDINGLLSEMSELLGRYDYDERASFLSDLAARASPDAGFWQVLAGPELWGGSGAVWEIGPFYRSDPSRPMRPDDHRRFKALLVELARILDSQGLGARASGIAEVLRRDVSDTGS